MTTNDTKSLKMLAHIQIIVNGIYNHVNVLGHLGLPLWYNNKTQNNRMTKTSKV